MELLTQKRRLGLFNVRIVSNATMVDDDPSYTWEHKHDQTATYGSNYNTQKAAVRAAWNYLADHNVSLSFQVDALVPDRMITKAQRLLWLGVVLCYQKDEDGDVYWFAQNHSNADAITVLARRTTLKDCIRNAWASLVAEMEDNREQA